MATKTKTIYGPKPTEVSVTQKQTTGTNIATITVNGTATELYAPNGGSGGGSDLPVGLTVGSLLIQPLSDEEFATLKSGTVGTIIQRDVTNSTNFDGALEVLGRYAKSVTGMTSCVGIVPIYLAGESQSNGLMILEWSKLGDGDPTYSATIVYDGIMQHFGSSPDSSQFFFGRIAVTLDTNGISYDETTHIFTISGTLTLSHITFVLFNSIESGGSGSGAGVSDVDWTGQYNADNGVELGTLTITTTD